MCLQLCKFKALHAELVALLKLATELITSSSVKTFMPGMLVLSLSFFFFGVTHSFNARDEYSLDKRDQKQDGAGC